MELLVGSTFPEVEPRLSHDGRRLVFASKRSSDSLDIWMAEADGSGAQLLIRGPSGIQGSPYWSPDGRRVVFDSFGDDYHWHIWTIDAEGGTPRRLTTQAGDENTPTWSHDGRYIYFSADPGSGRDIWRVLASGGIPERLTRRVRGFFACESADGKSLLFQPEDADTPLMAMALTGGDVRQLVTCVRNTAFGAGRDGVYYVPCDASPSPPHPCHRSGNRSEPAPRHARRTHGPTAGSGCITRWEDNRVSEKRAFHCRPDVDRELQVSRGVPPNGDRLLVWTE